MVFLFPIWENDLTDGVGFLGQTAAKCALDSIDRQEAAGRGCECE